MCEPVEAERTFDVECVNCNVGHGGNQAQEWHAFGRVEELPVRGDQIGWVAFTKAACIGIDAAMKAGHADNTDDELSLGNLLQADEVTKHVAHPPATAQRRLIPLLVDETVELVTQRAAVRRQRFGELVFTHVTNVSPTGQPGRPYAGVVFVSVERP